MWFKWLVIIILATASFSISFLAYSADKGDKKGCEAFLQIEPGSSLPSIPVPLALLENTVEVQFQGIRIQTSAKGRSLTFIFGHGGPFLRVHEDGEVDAQGFDVGTPRADGSNVKVRISHMSPEIAKGLIRYAYHYSYSDRERAWGRTLEFVFNETPELFMTGWNHIYGSQTYRPKKFRPHLDLDQ